MQFGSLRFDVQEGKIGLVGHGGVSTPLFGFAEVQICGENKPTNSGAKTAKTSQGIQLAYESAEQVGNKLIIAQRSDKIRVKTTFEKRENTSAIRIFSEVTNISQEPIILEEVAFCIKGLFGADIEYPKEVFFTKFYQGHHQECQCRRQSLFEHGFSKANDESQHRVAHANVGSQSTKEVLPQGVIEHDGKFCMFQIESNHSWLYELGDYLATYYLTLSTANYTHLNWIKKLSAGESYTSLPMAITFGESLEEVVGDMTNYRRTLIPKDGVDEKQPIVFNEYMYFSWDSPLEERTRALAPLVASFGADVYVIDCGWHDEVAGNIIYPYVGKWQQSAARFPSGVRKTTDYIRSLGMKAGLWIEPEIVGMLCEEMISYYGKDCFVQRFGQPIIVGRRMFLDYRNRRVREYLTESIRRMVEDYGADYIKFDYNQDMGVGTDLNALSAGEGLELISEAFLSWVEEIRARFPQVIFENCASGGCRLDYSSLSRFHLASTSDCSSYALYPYISANLSAAILPQQAGVWCYPVANLATAEEISLDRVAVNVVNALLGRMHLASNLAVLNDEQKALLQEGITLYKQLNEVRAKGMPVLPLGLAKRGDSLLASGLKAGDETYLCVWNMDEKEEITLHLGRTVQAAEVLYPTARGTEVRVKGEEISLRFGKIRAAAFLKIRG